jgi:hypothetical protein
MTRKGEGSSRADAQGMGHEVELAEDGQKAIEVYKKRRALAVPLMWCSWI